MENEVTINKEKVLAALAELGTGPKSIRANLNKIGIKGKRGDSCNCPISNYLKSEFIIPTGCYFSTYSLVILIKPTHPCGGTDLLRGTETPSCVFKFIALFDKGRYPELVDTTSFEK